MKYLILLALAAGLSACDKKGSYDDAKARARAEEEARNESTKERTRAEEEARMESAKERTKAEEEARLESAKKRAQLEEEASRDVNLKAQAEKAAKMEADLAMRHNYYNSLEGEYEGSLQTGDDTYQIKFTLARSLPPYMGSRVRELSEIETDLNNLYFHMQVVQWHPADSASAVGCRFSELRPDINKGSLIAASSECLNLYNVLISEGGAQALTQKDTKAKNLARKITKLQVDLVKYLVGTVQPSSNSTKYSFTVKRVQ